MSKYKKIGIILATILIILLLNNKVFRYFNDKRQFVSYLIEQYSGRNEKIIEDKLNKNDFELLYIQKNNGFNIYYYVGYGAFVNSAIAQDCYGGLELYSGHNNGGSRRTYSTYYMYGIKGDEVYTIEHLLYKKIIDPKDFLKAWEELRDKNKVLGSVKECY